MALWDSFGRKQSTIRKSARKQPVAHIAAHVEGLEERSLLSAVIGGAAVATFTSADVASGALIIENLDIDSNPTRGGVRADLNNVQNFDRLVVRASDITTNGLYGIQLNLSNLRVKEIVIEGLNVQGNGGVGLILNLSNVRADSVVIRDSQFNANNGPGVCIVGSAGTDLRNVVISGNSINGNTGASSDGLEIQLTSSRISGLAIRDNVGIDDNGAHGVNFDLNNSTITGLDIRNNRPGSGAAVGLGFVISGQTLTAPYSIQNVSSSAFITRFRMDIATADSGPYIFHTDPATGAATPFTPVNNTDGTTGLTSVNGTAVPPYPNTLVPNYSSNFDLQFNDFQPGETFSWSIDVDRTPGGDEGVDGAELIGSTITIDFSNGAQVIGTLVAVPGDPQGSQFQATQGGTFGSGISGNRLNGINFTNVNSEVEGVIENNLIDGNLGHGIYVDPRSTNSIVRNMDIHRITGNDITGNSGSGIFVDLRQNTTFDADILGNRITSNGGFGISVTGRDTVTAFNLLIGDYGAADRNVIRENFGAGIALTLDDSTGNDGDTTGKFSIINNEIGNTRNGGATFGGDGIHLRARGSTVLVNGRASLFNSTIDANLIESNVRDGLRIEISEDSELAHFTFGNTTGRNNDDGNIVRNNGGDGINFLRRDLAVVRDIQIIDNLFQNNADGIDITIRNSFATSDFTIDDNEILNNNGRGVHLRTEADAVLLANIKGNLIDGNASHGIHLTGRENAATDQQNINGSYLKNTISNNGGHGIFSTTVVGVTHQHVIGAMGFDFDGQSLGNRILNNGQTGVYLTSAGWTSIVNNIISSNGTANSDPYQGGRGIDVEVTVNPREVQILNNVIEGNSGTGIELQNTGGNLRVLAQNNIIDLNGGRGVDILNRTTGPFSPNSYVVFGNGIPRGNPDSAANNIRSNGLEGFYVVNTSSASQEQAVDATAALAADGPLNRTPNLVLDVSGNEIKQNGFGSSLNGTGLVLRVGTSNSNFNSGSFGASLLGDLTGDASPFGSAAASGLGSNSSMVGNGRVNAKIANNEFQGNFGDDIIMESFTSTVTPDTTTDIWGDPAGNPPYRVQGGYDRDPLARLNLTFEGNTADSVDVSRIGAFYNNNEDVFKSRTNNKTAPNPNGPFSSGTRNRNAQRVAARQGSTAAPFGGPNAAYFGGALGMASAIAEPSGNVLITVPANLTRNGAVTNATNATPIVITSGTQHFLQTGDQVTVSGVQGNTAANGTWIITVTSPTQFVLNGSVGNAAYTANTGSWSAVVGRHGLTNSDSVFVQNLIFDRGGFDFDQDANGRFRVQTTADPATFRIMVAEQHRIVEGTVFNLGSWFHLNPNAFQYDGTGDSTFRVESLGGEYFYGSTFTSDALNASNNIIGIDGSDYFTTTTFRGGVNEFGYGWDPVLPGTFSNLTALISDATIVEGDNRDVFAVFTVTISEPPPIPLRLFWQTADGTGLAGIDYAAGAGQLTFNPAGPLTQQISVRVLGDTLPENDETFFVNLFTQQSIDAFGQTQGIVAVDSIGMGAIVDNDGIPTVSIDPTATGPSGPRPLEGEPATFTVRLSRPASEVVSVEYSTSDGTATAGADYVRTGGIVVFQPGETVKTITINTIQDDRTERNETFNLTLRRAANAVLGNDNSVATIQDDDIPYVRTGPTVDVFGTADDDSFRLQVTATQFIVYVNDVQLVPFDRIDTARINFDGRGGEDTLRVDGHTESETVILSPAALAMIGPGYEVYSTSTEEIRFYSGGGNDRTEFRDSAGADDFRGSQAFSWMTGAGYYNYAADVRTVDAHSTAGGADTAVLVDTAGVETFVGRPSLGVFTGTGYAINVYAFETVDASGRNGGTDTAQLYDGAGNDALSARPTVVSLSGSNFNNIARGFSRVDAYADAGGNDRADLYDSSGNDSFVSGQDTFGRYARMSGTGFDNFTRGFERVDGHARSGGNDTARLRDSVSDDLFRSRPTVSFFVTPLDTVYARGFDRVDAYSLNGGSDTAYVYGQPGTAETIILRPNFGNSTGVGYANFARGFARVEAFGGAEDRANMFDSDGDDLFVSDGVRSYLRGAGFLNFAKGFGRVDAFAGAGDDRALFRDTAGNDVFNARATVASMSGTGFSNSASDFERVDAYSALGTDRAVLRDSAGNDHFLGREDLSRMTGARFSNTVRGFSRVDAFSENGGRDVADLYDTSGDDTFVMQDDRSYVSGASFGNFVNDFARVNAHSVNGGSDRVKMYDSAGNDAFVGRTDRSQFTGTNFANYAYGFARVDAYSTAGFDSARMFDGTGNDRFVGRFDVSSLTGAGYEMYARNFSTVEARASGGTDTADLHDSAGADTFTSSGRTTVLAGAGFSNVAVNFERVRGFGSSPSDRAIFNDTAGNDRFTARELNGRMTGSGFDNSAIGFSTMNAFSNLGGTDRADFYDSNRKDFFTATPTDARLQATNFTNTATGFAQVFAYSVNGGDDEANLEGSSRAEHLLDTQTFTRFTGVGFQHQIEGFSKITVQGRNRNDTAEFRDMNSPDDFFSGYQNVATASRPVRRTITARDFARVTAVAQPGRTAFGSVQNNIDYIFEAIGDWAGSMP